MTSRLFQTLGTWLGKTVVFRHTQPGYALGQPT
jgi:hypothetical protein